MVLEFLKFPLFLKVFEPISLLWTLSGSLREASTLCWGWAVTVLHLYTLFYNLPTEGSGTPTDKGGTYSEQGEDARED